MIFVLWQSRRQKKMDDVSNQCFTNVSPSGGKRIIVLNAKSDAGWVNDALLISSKNVKEAEANYQKITCQQPYLIKCWFYEKYYPDKPLI